jgi:hypothetical protein
MVNTPSNKIILFVSTQNLFTTPEKKIITVWLKEEIGQAGAQAVRSSHVSVYASKQLVVWQSAMRPFYFP